MVEWAGWDSQLSRERAQVAHILSHRDPRTHIMKRVGVPEGLSLCGTEACSFYAHACTQKSVGRYVTAKSVSRRKIKNTCSYQHL